MLSWIRSGATSSKSRVSAWIGAAIVVVSLAVPVVVFAANGHFSAVPLDGAHENPPRLTDATGVAQFKLSKDGQSLEYHLNVQNISNVFQAHIHRGPATDNGPIVVWLYPSTAPTPGPLGQGPISGNIASGTITAANFVGPLAGRPMSELLSLLDSGGAYVNVHTNDGVGATNTGPGDFPGGEIRNQVRGHGSH
jgi:hypothetical protein